MGDDAVPEGTALVYNVALSQPSTTATTFTYVLGGGSASPADIGEVTFTRGVTYNAATGLITVPANVDRFAVIVQTLADRILEPTETLPLTIGGVTGIGSILDVNTRPQLAVAGNTGVSEEALQGGIVTPGTSPVSKVSGALTVTDPEGGPYTFTVQQPPQAFKSGGNAVMWGSPVTSADGTVTLEGRTSVAAGNVLIATLKLLPTQSQYEFELFKPLDDYDPAGNPVGSLTYSFQLSVTDSTGLISTPATLSVAIADDTPATALPIPREAPVTDVNSNVMLILDVSTSMNQASGIPGLTKLQAAIQSIGTLLDRYDELGDVRVRIETFGTHANGLGTAWLSVGDARALLAGIVIQTNQGTNYDEALGDANELFNSPGKITGGQNVVYFLSDGQPTFGSGTPLSTRTSRQRRQCRSDGQRHWAAGPDQYQFA